MKTPKVKMSPGKMKALWIGAMSWNFVTFLDRVVDYLAEGKPFGLSVEAFGLECIVTFCGFFSD